MFAPPVCWDLELPEHFDEAARFVRDEDMREGVLISSDPRRFDGWLKEYASHGFDGTILHHVGLEQREFIETFGKRVLPDLSRS